MCGWQPMKVNEWESISGHFFAAVILIPHTILRNRYQRTCEGVLNRRSWIWIINRLAQKQTVYFYRARAFSQVANKNLFRADYEASVFTADEETQWPISFLKHGSYQKALTTRVNQPWKQAKWNFKHKTDLPISLPPFWKFCIFYKVLSE